MKIGLSGKYIDRIFSDKFSATAVKAIRTGSEIKTPVRNFGNMTVNSMSGNDLSTVVREMSYLQAPTNYSKYAIDSQTKLLFHFDNSFTDSAAGRTVTNTGVTFSSSVYKFGTYSAYFVNDTYMEVPDSTDWDFGVGNFTIDFWVNFTDITQNQAVGSQIQDANNSWTFWKFQETGHQWSFQWIVGGVTRAEYYASTWSPSTGVWYHIALVRIGTSLKLYIDGTEKTWQTIATAIGTNALDGITAPYRIGDVPSNMPLKGYIDEYRVTKGIARWTSNFTPPDLPYPCYGSINIGGEIQNTPRRVGMTVDIEGVNSDELTAYVSRTTERDLVTYIIANNGVEDLVGRDITVGSVVTLDTSVKKYGTQSIKFSDNANSYIQLPNSGDLRFGYDDITIDWWARFYGHSAGASFVYSNRYGSPGKSQMYFLTNPISYFVVEDWSPDVAATNNGFSFNIAPLSLTLNVWYHFAIVRKHPYWYFFVDGVLAGTTQASINLWYYTSAPFLLMNGNYGANNFDGWMQDFRITRRARWTSNFTVPSTYGSLGDFTTATLTKCGDNLYRSDMVDVSGQSSGQSIGCKLDIKSSAAQVRGIAVYGR